MAAAEQEVQHLRPCLHTQRLDDEAGLVARLRQREPEACLAFYQLTAAPIYSLLAFMLQDECEAEALFCELFQEMWENIAEYDSTRGSFTTWAILLARQKALRRMRTRGCPQDHPLARRLQNPGHDGDADRAVLELALFCGMNPAEICEWLGQPLNVVRGCLCRALRREADAAVERSHAA